MAVTKKNATVNKEETKCAAKATVKKAPAKVEAAKVEAPKAEEVKAEVKAVEKKPAKPAEKKAAVTPAEKKTAAKPAAKKEVKSEITLQFSGKSYTQEELIKIAKDVWKYDLQQKATDLTSIELYVKPEENVAYYVMNKEFTGSFYL